MYGGGRVKAGLPDQPLQMEKLSQRGRAGPGRHWALSCVLGTAAGRPCTDPSDFEQRGRVGKPRLGVSTWHLVEVGEAFCSSVPARAGGGGALGPERGPGLRKVPVRGTGCLRLGRQLWGSPASISKRAGVLLGPQPARAGAGAKS